MKLTVESNAPEHAKALADFIRFKRWTIAKGLRFEGRQIAGLLIKLTPPRTRQQGRQAVARDIRRAVVPLRPQDFDSPKIKALIRARNYSGLTAVFSRFQRGELRNIDVRPFDPSLHTKARDRRGRVRGRPKFASPDAREITDYIKRVQGNVGRGKGGWASSFIGLGGRPSAWIGEHSNTGDLLDHADNPITPYIQMENRSEWASRGDDERIVANAIRSRTTSIRTAIQKSLEEAKHQAGIH